MKLLIGFLALVLALCISGVAAYFSVVGLAAIFSATAGAVIIMGCALEAGKLVTAGWLHQNWSNPRVTKLHKGYMVTATIALMLITALGIYGFLAKGHLEEQTPLAPVELQIASKQADIDAINTDIKSQQTRLLQLDSAINSMIGNNDAALGLRYRSKQSSERKQIQNAIDVDNSKIQQISKDLVPLKLQINEVETKLGPVKYVADLFGIRDTESAVRIVILVLMFAFDPLAVALIISSAISFGDGLQEIEERKKKNAITSISKSSIFAKDKGIVLPEGHEEENTFVFDHQNSPVSDQPNSLLAELEEHSSKSAVLHSEPIREMTDKDRLLDILERKPELLQTIVEAVKDDQHHKEEKKTVYNNDSWLDAGTTK